MERTTNLIIFSHDLWIFEQCKKLEDNLIANIENSVVVTTIYFWTDCRRNIYWFHWTLHEEGLFARPYRKVNPVKRIIIDSKSEMCKWFIFKRLFPIHFCSEWLQYEEQYALYYAN